MQRAIQAAAVDIGGESGRVILGRFDGRRLELTEAHRFPNVPLRMPTGLHWNLPGLFREVLEGLRRARHQAGTDLASLGVDTWGVDFGLVDRTGALLGLPFHYRDPRTEGLLKAASDAVGRQRIFAGTGIQFMEINTLYQLLAMVRGGAPTLQAAERLLMVPDLLAYWLTGVMANEWTNATTTQCFSVTGGTWDCGLLADLGIPTHFLRETCMPGTDLGCLTPASLLETGCTATHAIAVGTHDTASAIAAVPGTGADVAYISSGTWSLVGVVSREPVISPAALQANVTNEGAVDGSYRVLKNVMGLWLLQQVQRSLAASGREYSYAELMELARRAPGETALFDPDEPSFLRHGDMPSLIREACRQTGQEPPAEVGALVRSILASLACKYRWVLERLEEVTGRRISTIHVVGGGAKNALLSQLTADVSGRMVWAGPAEATAVGNVVVQLTALGHIGSSADYPEVVRASFAPILYEPAGGQSDDGLYARWREITNA